MGPRFGLSSSEILFSPARQGLCPCTLALTNWCWSTPMMLGLGHNLTSMKQATWFYTLPTQRYTRFLWHASHSEHDMVIAPVVSQVCDIRSQRLSPILAWSFQKIGALHQLSAMWTWRPVSYKTVGRWSSLISQTNSWLPRGYQNLSFKI